MEPATATLSLLQQITNFGTDVGRQLVQWSEERIENPILLERLIQDTCRNAEDMVASIESIILLAEASNEGNSLAWPIQRHRLQNLCTKLKRLHLDSTGLDAAKKRSQLYPKLLGQKIRSLNDNLDLVVSEANELVSAIQQPSLSQVPSSHAFPTGFRVVRNVDRYPPVGVMDFESKDIHGKPLTYEAQFKHAIFNQTSSTVIGAVAQGPGGVGKSCALRAIGLLEEADIRFPGGTLYVTIGADGGLSSLIEKVTDILEKAGGSKVAACIRDKPILENAVAKTGEWFQEKPCLFLIDDVWCTNGITRASIGQLANLAKHPKSSIAITARDKSVTLGKKIIFKERELHGPKAHAILLECAGLDHPTSTDARDAFDKILDLCGGLPITLSGSGATVRYFAEGRCSNYPESAWQHFLAEYDRLPLLSLDTDWSEVQSYLKHSTLLSLGLIDEYLSEKNSRERFEALCVLRKQQYIPLGVGQRVWNVTEDEARKFIYLLERFAIIRVYVSNRSDLAIGLHDVYLEMSQAMAEKNGTMEKWSTALLTSYAPSIAGNTPTGDGIRKWLMGVEDDGFIYRNVARLLTLGQYYEDLLGLMTDPRWVTRQLKRNGNWQVDEDIQLTLDGIKKVVKLGSNENHDAEAFLSVLQQAAHMSSRRVREVEWVGMPWFELCGRMAHLEGENKFVKAFLESLRLDAPRPWLHPSVGCLPAAGDSLCHEIGVNGWILCHEQVDDILLVCYIAEIEGRQSVLLTRYNLSTRYETDSDILIQSANDRNIFRSADLCLAAGLFTVGVGNGDIAVVSLSKHKPTDFPENHETLGQNVDDKSESQSDDDNETVKCSFRPWSCFSGMKSRSAESTSLSSRRSSLREPPEVSVTSKYEMEILRCQCDDVYCVVVKDIGQSRCIMAGFRDGTVRVWVWDGARWEGEELGGHDESVKSVAVSADGQHLASVSRDGTVFMWEIGREGWECEELEGHDEAVQSVAICANGKVVVSGSEDRTVKIREKKGADWRSIELRGHKGFLQDIILSDDGRRLVSGSEDGTVMIWEMEDTDWQRWRGAELMGHKGLLLSVGMSADSRHVVSASWDQTVRVWDVEKEQWRGSQLLLPRGWIRSVALSDDGRRVVTGSSDWMVRVWEKEGIGWKSLELKGHEGEIWSVGVCGNGQRIVSGSSDETVRVWDMDGTEWRSVVLHGHSYWVHAAISRDGSRLVSGSHDGTVKVWEMVGKEWKSEELKGHNSGAQDVAMSADGRKIACHLFSGYRCVWNWNGTEWEIFPGDHSEEMASMRKERMWAFWPNDLDQSLIEQVILPLGDVYATASGFFITVNRQPYVGQVDILWH